MKKLKIYLETTVFNWFFEPERDFYKDTHQLFDEIAAGKFEAYASDYVVEELAQATEPKRRMMLDLLEQSRIEMLGKSDEVAALAQQYVLHNIISKKHRYDREHIACAAVNGMNAIISFNFAHINRYSTREKTDLVNRLNGYPTVQIIMPMEVIDVEVV
ncbi:MAG: hypothetical protein FWE98_06525 [Oscillospiraceae bacterium]|nr:hypothetical protein [Oscillospiraceae bacterium]